MRFIQTLCGAGIGLLLTIPCVFSAENSAPSPLHPFEIRSWTIPENPVDLLVFSLLRSHGIEASFPSSDETFIRRAYLDIIGTLPSPSETLAFLANQSKDKRITLIDTLLAREEFADYWSLKWADILRMKAEFPVNLWPNAVQAYHRWVRDAIRSNMPYDQFVRALLTSSGSNFRVPEVNFYRAVQTRTPASLASAAALTFMGSRIEQWEEKKQTGFSLFFSRVSYKKSAEWKEEIVLCNPAPATSINAMLPDGKSITIPADQDPRIIFADWLISPQNPWFAKNIVNRIWFWLMGTPIIEGVDDIRPDNPPSNPELLAFLEKELVSSGYNLRHLYRLILTSRTWQQSSIPQSSHPKARSLFAYYPVRRVEAEVLRDALFTIGKRGEEYMSPIPEPYTFIPEEQKNVLLADGSITSPFLELFGRPPRDTGLESERNNTISDSQERYMLASTDIQRIITRSPLLQRIIRTSKNSRDEIIRNYYLFILSRYPTEEEALIAAQYFKKPELRIKEAADDLAWALINSKEFLYRH